MLTSKQEDAQASAAQFASDSKGKASSADNAAPLTTCESASVSQDSRALKPLDLSELTQLLSGDSFWQVQTFGCVDSTNRIVKQALAEGIAEGFCATALQQKGGYGRQGRVWESPLGGLYTSITLRPQVPLQQLPTLSLVMSVAVRRALIQVCSDPLAIKWPNDVLYCGGKIAGISLEVIAGGVCVGIGLNVFPPAQCMEVSGKYSLSYIREDVVVDSISADQRLFMARVLTMLIQEVKLCYQQWGDQGFASFLDEYREHMAWLGAHVQLETIDGSSFAEVEICGVDEEGYLLVRAASGDIMRAASGEVHVRALS